MAAEGNATLIIRLKDMASSGLKGFTSTLSGLKSAFLATTATVAAFVAAGMSAIKAYSESENAITKLESALRNQGIEVENNSLAAQEFAAQMQKLTGVSDEAVIESQALLTTFGMQGKAMQDAEKAALDLSVRFGIDLNSATLAVGRAYQGNTMQLERMVGKIDDATPITQKYATVMELVASRAGGAAEAMGQTLSGRIAILKERFNDLQETLGASLLPVFEMAMSVMEFFAEKLEVISGAIREAGSAWTVFQMAMLEGSKLLLESFLAVFEPIFMLLERFGFDMDTVTMRINAAIDRQIAKIQQAAIVHKAATSARVSHERGAMTEQSAWMDGERAKELEKQNKFYDSIKSRVDKHFEDEKNARNKDVEMQEKVNQQKMANWQSTLNTISTLSQAHNKNLAAVGKAAAIAQATIDTYLGIGRAWAMGPIVGPPLAALVAAAGFANVARISGVKLAEGGIVMPRPGGVQATIGEAGQAEAVIPLGDDRAQAMLGGGKTEIHIHAGTIVADRSSVREFAVMIDRELYNLERNRLSVRT